MCVAMNPELSIITTLYKSKNFIDEFLDKALLAGENSGKKFEIIVVDDGSPDDSMKLAVERVRFDSRIQVIELSRNFGHHPAFWCGMHYAQGEYCFLIDSDLEVSPLILSEFEKIMENSKADVVYGVQEIRQGKEYARIFGGLFWRIFSLLSSVDVPSNIMTERLMNRKYLNALLSMGDHNLFLGGMFYWPGFKQIPLSVMKMSRKGGTSYSFLDRFKLLVEAVSSFSSMPLILIFWLGFGIFNMGSFYLLYLLIRKILFPWSILDGFTFLALMSLGSLSVLLMAIGIIGLYIHRIFKQVQGRPIYIVKNIYSKDGI